MVTTLWDWTFNSILLEKRHPHLSAPLQTSRASSSLKRLRELQRTDFLTDRSTELCRRERPDSQTSSSFRTRHTFGSSGGHGRGDMPAAMSAALLLGGMSLNLKLCTFNARGFNVTEKPSKILYGLHKDRVSVLFLQVTHFKTCHVPAIHSRYFLVVSQHESDGQIQRGLNCYPLDVSSCGSRFQGGSRGALLIS